MARIKRHNNIRRAFPSATLPLEPYSAAAAAAAAAAKAAPAAALPVAAAAVQQKLRL